MVDRLLENPYWQYFCGYEYFVHELLVDPTSLVKWRKRVIGHLKSDNRLDQNPASIGCFMGMVSHVPFTNGVKQ